MFKSFVIFLLLAVVVVGTACSSPSATPMPTPTLPTSTPIDMPTPTLGCAFTSWKLCPLGVWLCGCSAAFNEYDSEFLLGRLLQYKPFKDFYNNEVKPLGFTIRYIYNPNLIPNTANTSADGRTHTAIVELGNISPNQDLNFIIAHELAVIVAANYGLRTSLITLQPQDSSCANLVENMRDMMSTPFRDGILASYGFDVEREFYAHRIPPLFSLACDEGNNTLENLGDACQYVKLVLYWQAILHKPGTPPIIERWWHDCRPTAWTMGQDILAMIPTERLITPQDITTLFGNIIQKYKLQDCVSLP